MRGTFPFAISESLETELLKFPNPTPIVCLSSPSPSVLNNHSSYN